MWTTLTIIAIVCVVIIVVVRVASRRRRSTRDKRFEQPVTMVPESDAKQPDVEELDARDAEGRLIPGSREHRERHGKP